MKLREPGDPCDGAARAATLAELSTTVPVWAPVGEEFTDAFICGGEPTLLYGGVEITYEDGWGHAAPDMLRRMVAQDGGRIQEINGRPVYVHPADETGPRNGVWILAGDYSVKLTAKPGIGIDRVVELARKIHIPASVG